MGKWAKYPRSYRREWERDPDFKDWLMPSSSGDMAYCRVCKAELRSHAQDLKAHISRAKHQRNMQLAAATIRPGPLDNFVQLEPRIQSQQAHRQVKTVELRLAAHVAVHSSIMTADHLTPLLKDCFKDSVTATALSMGRTKCTSFITKVLGPTFKEMILSDMKACKYSLLLDKSTDVSATKELAVVPRHYSKKTNSFCTSFLGLVPIHDAASGGLFSSLSMFLSSCDLALEDCIGIGSDGASVMCGRNNSLFSRMKEVNSGLILVRCVCHSLHLACNEAVSLLPTQVDFLVNASTGSRTRPNGSRSITLCSLPSILVTGPRS
ncbi:unnamed protein product [Ixodes hexagonus]